METKVCPKCKIEKPKSEFYKNKLRKDGLYFWCRECTKEKRRKWYKANSEKVKKRSRKWIKANPEKARESNRKSSRKWQNKKRKTNPKYRLDCNMRNMLWFALKGQKAKRRWEELVGYTIEALVKHLEKQFTEKMSWDNYGEWHVDHIRARACFHYVCPEDPEFKECWALKNLQPLWGLDNISKGAKPYEIWLLNKKVEA